MPRHYVVLLIVLLVVNALTAHCQWMQTTTDSLVDVFPLSVGNQWTYRYFLLMENWPSGNPFETRVDSGRTVYEVTSFVRTNDSTVWHMKERRDVMRHQILYYGEGSPRDTTYPISDSTSVELIESHDGRHMVYRNANPYLIRQDIFPFTREFVDTTSIYRFARVDAGDTVAFQSWIAPPKSPSFRSSFTFKKNVGLVHNIYNSGTIDVYSSNDHVLLSSIVASINHNVVFSVPSSFVLYQNYPNPFNPSTTIRYGLSNRSHVTLTVFNTLGQQVAQLVNGEVDAGFHEVRFDGAGLSSGVYFYRLQAGTYVGTKSFVLAK